MKHVDDHIERINVALKEVLGDAIVKLAETKALSRTIMDQPPEMRESKMKDIYGCWRDFLKE